MKIQSIINVVSIHTSIASLTHLITIHRFKHAASSAFHVWNDEWLLCELNLLYCLSVHNPYLSQHFLYDE